ncbi:MAG TPA: hypothetical protein EYP78_06280 [Candidatus Omnitrophica bacterium]|nr:hypothetical protein [Candidatus Omnitrophota bacterium]
MQGKRNPKNKVLSPRSPLIYRRKTIRGTVTTGPVFSEDVVDWNISARVGARYWGMIKREFTTRKYLLRAKHPA